MDYCTMKVKLPVSKHNVVKAKGCNVKYFLDVAPEGSRRIASNSYCLIICTKLTRG
jgi:hypothetical protein